MEESRRAYGAYLREVHLLGGKHERVRDQQAALFGHLYRVCPESGLAIACVMLLTSLLPATEATTKSGYDLSCRHRCMQHATRCNKRVIICFKRSIWSTGVVEVGSTTTFTCALSGLTSLAALGAALAAAVEAFWLAIRRALNSRQSVSAWAAGRLSGMPSSCVSGCLEPSLLSELCLCRL